MKQIAEVLIDVSQGQSIPYDGEAVEGFAFVDESAIAGVSTAAMIDPEGGGRSEVMAGGVIVEGRIKMRRHPT